MAKEVKKAKSKEKVAKESAVKIAGTFRPGTAVAKLYLKLEDGKTHKLTDLKKLIAGEKVNFEGRLYRIDRYIKRVGMGELQFNEDEGLVRMVLKRKTPAAVAAAPAKDKKATKASASVRPESKAAKKVAKPKKEKPAPAEDEEDEEEVDVASDDDTDDTDE